MKRGAVLMLLCLAGCSEGSAPSATGPGGAALEREAKARGLVTDAASPVGVFQTDTDRVCVLPVGDGYVIGASVDYGEGQRCAARGKATGGQTLRVDFGADCRFEARLDADRLIFPAVLPDACAASCVGRASLAAIRAARLGDAAAEAARTRGSDGALLCPG